MTASVLMAVEMLKELPLTLILRPFRLETLATNVFRLAGNEQLINAAPYALVLIAAGLGPVPDPQPRGCLRPQPATALLTLPCSGTGARETLRHPPGGT